MENEPMSRFRQSRRPGVRRALHSTALLLTLIVGMVLGANSPFAGADTNIDDTEAWNTFEQVWDILMDQYVDPESLDPDTLIYGAISGMVEAVGDTGHTRFTNPDDAARQDTDLQGEYVGVGISIDTSLARPFIASVFPNSPAEEAGVRAGDMIREANGIDLFGMRSEDLNQAFLTDEGEPIVLLLQRGDGEPFEVELFRAVIEIDPVSWWMIDGNIAHILYTSFVEGSADEVAQAVQEAIDEGAEYFILDLRNNGGGRITELVKTASIFLPTGTPIQRLEYRDGTTETLTVRNGHDFAYPMVILTNRGTASASEVTTAAINQARVATVIGEVTSGTGTGLANQDFEDGSHLSYAVVLWLTPNGESIWKVGYQPDIEVELGSSLDRVTPQQGEDATRSSIDAGNDTQLQTAIQFLLGEFEDD
jgi:carboxyl-terminal processing protease